MKIRLSEYEEGVVDGREESAEIMRLKQSEIEALTAHIKNLTKGTIRQQQAEIEALKAVLEQEGIGVGRDLLNGGIALFRKAS